RWRANFQDAAGGERVLLEEERPVDRRRWQVVPVETARLHAPDEPGLLTLAAWFEDASGTIRGRNYVQWVLARPDGEGASSADIRLDGSRVVPFAPGSYVCAEWPLIRSVNDGEKVSGLGAGSFAYEVALPPELTPESIGRCELLLEAGARRT